MLRAGKRLGAGQFGRCTSQARTTRYGPSTHIFSLVWHHGMEIYQVHMRRTALNVFSTIPSGAIRPASLSTGIVILPASVLRHMADSDHPPREATPLDQRPAPPRAKKDAGSGEAQARADFDPSADALLRLTSNDEDKQLPSLTPGEEHGLFGDPQKILDPTDRCISGRISALNLAKVRQACSQYLWDDFIQSSANSPRLSRQI